VPIRGQGKKKKTAAGLWCQPTPEIKWGWLKVRVEMRVVTEGGGSVRIEMCGDEREMVRL
jgi:hypothetical protein